MAKKAIINPQLIVLPDHPGTNGADAATNLYLVLTPVYSGASDFTQSVEALQVTTSENNGHVANVQGLVDGSFGFDFAGNDAVRDYSVIKSQIGLRRPAQFFVVDGDGALSPENIGFMFNGILTTIPRATPIGQVASFTISVMPGPSFTGVIDADAATDFTGTYANVPVT